jgi:hypothetical protein
MLFEFATLGKVKAALNAKDAVGNDRGAAGGANRTFVLDEPHVSVQAIQGTSG